MEKSGKKKFTPLPFATTNIHLYESLGNSSYIPLNTIPVKKPFEEIEHTADIAFIVRGWSLDELYHNGFTALAFKFPQLLPFFIKQVELSTVEDVIMAINQCLCEADTKIGCPMKGVSFHGQAAKQNDDTLEWEMIVDV